MKCVILLIAAIIAGVNGLPVKGHAKEEVPEYNVEGFFPVELSRALDLKALVNSFEPFSPIEREGEGNANDYVDKMLVNLKEYILKNMEPLNIGPQGDYIKHMQLSGLSTIFRSGTATIKRDGETALLSANLGFSNLRGEADIEKNIFWEIWITGKAVAKIRGLSLYGEMRLDLIGSGKPQLEALSVNAWGDMETSFEGNNWLGQLAQIVSGEIPSVMNNFLKSNLLPWVRQGVEYVLDHIDFKFD